MIYQSYYLLLATRKKNFIILAVELIITEILRTGGSREMHSLEREGESYSLL